MNMPYLPSLQKQPHWKDNFWFRLFVLLSILFIMALWNSARAEEIDSALAVRAIVGEAANQGYRGLLAVAVGIRNRGTLQGVYGLKARHIDKEPKWVWDMARKAWEESKYNRIHSGTHWESIDFPKPRWANKMQEVYRYKKHIFYKLVRSK